MDLKKFNMENNLAKDIVDYLGTTKSHVSKAINNLIDKCDYILIPRIDNYGINKMY